MIKKVMKWLVVVLLLIIVIGGGFRYYFVFAEGTKAGVLNTFMKKGFIFKTYEGKIIQTGFRGNGSAGVQSYEFSFSVTDEKVAKILLENSGLEMELHYKQYLGALPWRGMQKYIVDSVYEIRSVNKPNAIQ